VACTLALYVVLAAREAGVAATLWPLPVSVDNICNANFAHLTEYTLPADPPRPAAPPCALCAGCALCGGLAADGRARACEQGASWARQQQCSLTRQ